MAEEFNNENTPENSVENPAGEVPVPDNQTAQPQEPNPTEQAAPEQATKEAAAHQEAQSQPQNPAGAPEFTAPQQNNGQQEPVNNGQPAVPPVNPAFQNGSVRKELIVLPIISFVISVITLLLAWLAPIPIIYVIIAFLALIYAVVSLIVNLKRKKVLSIIAIAVAAVVFLASGAAVFVRQPKDDQIKTERQEKKNDDEDVDDDDIDEDEDEEDSTDIEDYIADSSDYDYKWNESKFEDLEVSSYSNKKGDTVKSILKKFGKASEATINGNNLVLKYEGSSENDRVRLSFEKQYNGKFILTSSTMYTDSQEVKTSSRNSYKSNWTQADVNALAVGNRRTGVGGAKLDDIIKKHGNPVEARIVITNYGRGIEKSLKITYSDYSSSDDSKLSYVSLEFAEQSNGDYLLTYKYPRE